MKIAFLEVLKARGFKEFSPDEFFQSNKYFCFGNSFHSTSSLGFLSLFLALGVTELL